MGVPNGDDSTLAAAAEQHPNYQGKWSWQAWLLPPGRASGGSSAEMLGSLARTLNPLW